jgi:hypothetical protein
MSFITLKRKIIQPIIRVVLHPLTLSLAFSTILILIFLPKWTKYSAEIVNQNALRGHALIRFYADLDGNGFSDLIWCFNNSIGKAAVCVRLEPSAKMIQWNLNGRFNFQTTNFVTVDDYNRNNKKEIYLLTLAHDSVLLNILDYNLPSKPFMKDVLIDTVKTNNKTSDAAVCFGKTQDLDNDGYNEALLLITTGFSKYPRNIYAFNIPKKSIIRSPKNAYNYQYFRQGDVTGDGKPDIIPIGYSSENVFKKDYTYHDSSSWLMILDQNLSFLFPPVEFPSEKVEFVPLVDTFEVRHTGLIAIKYYDYSQGGKATLLKFDNMGRIKKEACINTFVSDRISYCLLWNDGKRTEILITLKNNTCLAFDTNLCFSGTRAIDLSNGPIFRMDIDKDDEYELLFANVSTNEVTIYRQDLSNPVSVNISLKSYDNWLFSRKEVLGKRPLLHIFDGETESLVEYRINPMFYWRWLVYFGVFLGVFGFTLLILKIQRVQLQRRSDTEKKITELQLKIVRNQMDPHFIMNAINSVIGAVQNEEKEAASQNLHHFSKMYRSLVESADKIKRTLNEELEFTENYLALEKFRYKGRFHYEVWLDRSLDPGIEIPKMILQIHVENAINHGLRGIEQGGLINIRCYPSNECLCIEISDNGIGRKQAALESEKSTGKGLQMMDQFYDLYFRITGRRVTCEISDIKNSTGDDCGTLVKILVPLT